MLCAESRFIVWFTFGDHEIMRIHKKLFDHDLAMPGRLHGHSSGRLIQWRLL